MSLTCKNQYGLGSSQLGTITHLTVPKNFQGQKRFLGDQ